jgi:hypothetical protein
MSGPRIIAEIPKNAREMIRVSLGEFHGRAVLDCRIWYQPGDGDMRPGSKGLTVAIRHLPQLADALAKAVLEAQESKLLPNT